MIAGAVTFALIVAGFVGYLIGLRRGWRAGLRMAGYIQTQGVEGVQIVRVKP